jgi:hypothetical protein
LGARSARRKRLEISLIRAEISLIRAVQNGVDRAETKQAEAGRIVATGVVTAPAELGKSA